MTTYVDVGIQRIQAHLARSRHLWGRRGASEEVVRLTMSPAAAKEKGIEAPPMAEVLALSGIEANDEAIDIDGVLSFKGRFEDDARDAGLLLARRLRTRLPGLTVQVSWITADVQPETGIEERYIDLLDPAQSRRWEKVTFRPAPYEFPLVRLCDECKVDPASHQAGKRFPDDPGVAPRLCADCFRRREHAERRRRTVVSIGPKHPNKFCVEWWLLSEINQARGGEELKGVDDLGKLGEMIRPDAAGHVRTHRDNHTALVFADGNGLGGLFEAAHRAAVEAGSTLEMQALSKGIGEALIVALKAATEKIILPGDDRLPVVPHVMGGDDLLVSLPAERCWEFLVEFLTRFQDAAEGLGVGDRRVSMSAGMVISKAELPLANQVEIAEQLLKRAKRGVDGQGWSFTWLDVTQDGPGGEHEVWTLEGLKDREPALGYLGEMSANSVQSIGGTLTSRDLGVMAQKLEYLAKRVDEVKCLLDKAGIKPSDRFDDSDARALKDLLSINRWWR